MVSARRTPAGWRFEGFASADAVKMWRSSPVTSLHHRHRYRWLPRLGGMVLVRKSPQQTRPVSGWRWIQHHRGTRSAALYLSPSRKTTRDGGLMMRLSDKSSLRDDAAYNIANTIRSNPQGILSDSSQKTNGFVAATTSIAKGFASGGYTLAIGRPTASGRRIQRVGALQSFASTDAGCRDHRPLLPHSDR